MCPEHVGLLDEIKIKLKKFDQGFLVQYTKYMNINDDREGLRRTKVDFHRHILKLEKEFQLQGFNEVWGMMAGNCELCSTCKAITEEIS